MSKYGKLLNTKALRRQADEIINKISSSGIETNELTVLYIGERYTLVKTAGGSYYDNGGRNYVSGHIDCFPLRNLKPDLYYRHDDYPRAHRVWDLSMEGRFSHGKNKEERRFGRLTEKRLAFLVREVEELEAKEKAAGKCKVCAKDLYGHGPIGDMSLKTQVCMPCSRAARDRLEEQHEQAEARKAALAIPKFLRSFQGEVKQLGEWIEDQYLAMTKYEDWERDVRSPSMIRDITKKIVDRMEETYDKLRGRYNETRKLK